MLVLSRQRDETIMIGDDIEVTVVDIRGDKVRLGITAPKEISVHFIAQLNREYLRAGVIQSGSRVSPEQVQGEPLVGRSDLFALGLVMLVTRTGQLIQAPVPLALAKLPVGGMPMKAPVWVPEEVWRVTTKFPSAT